MTTYGVNTVSEKLSELVEVAQGSRISDAQRMKIINLVRKVEQQSVQNCFALDALIEVCKASKGISAEAPVTIEF